MATKEEQAQLLKNLLEANKKIAADITAEFIKQQEALGEAVTASDQQLTSLNAHKDALQESYDYIKNISYEELFALDEKAKKLDEQYRKGKISLELYQAQKEELEEQIIHTGDLLTLTNEELDALKAKLQAEIDINRERAKAVGHGKAFAEQLASEAGQMFGITDAWKNTLGGRFMQARKAGLSFSDQMKIVNEEMKKQFSTANVLGSAYMKLTEFQTALVMGSWNMVTSLDSNRAEMRLATGTANELDEAYMATATSNLHLGIGAKESREAHAALGKTMAGFINMSTQQQTALGDLTAKLGKLGVATADTAAVMMFATQVLGEGADGAADLAMELESLSQTVKMNTGVVMQNFVKLLPQLAAHGDSASEVFAGMQKTARQTGIEVGKLMNIVSGFDRFDAAAEKVGNLNAILGGTFLDTTQMVMASEEERLKLLQQSIESSGRQWNEMNRFEKKAVAQAAGFDDINEAGRFFGEQGQDVEEYMDKQAKLEERIKAVQDITAKLRNTFNSLLTTFTPLVDVISFMADGLNILVNETGPLGKTIKILASALVGLWVISKVVIGAMALKAAAVNAYTFATNLSISSTRLSWVTDKIAAGWSKVRAAGAWAAAGAVKLLGLVSKKKAVADTASVAPAAAATAATVTQGAASGAAAGPTWALAGAILAIGVSIALVIGSIALLVMALKGMTGPEFAMLSVILLGIAAAIAVMAIMGTAAAPGLIALGVGLAAVGMPLFLIAAGIALIVASVALLIVAFTGLMDVILKSPEAFAQISGSLWLMSLSFMSLAYTVLFAAAGFALIVIPMFAFAAALWTVDLEKLQAMATVFAAMKDMGSGVAKQFNEMADAIEAIAEAAEKMPEGFGMEVNLMSTGLAELNKTAVKITPETTKNQKELVDQAIRFSSEAKNADVGFAESLMGELYNTGRASAKPKAASSGPQKLIFKIGEWEFAQMLGDLLKKYSDQVGVATVKELDIGQK